VLTETAKERLNQAVREFRNGNPGAFDDIFELSSSMVFRICVNMLNDYHAAEDIMQEVFLSVYKALPRFREESSFYTWIYRIAVNKSLSALKKKKETVIDRDEFPELDTGEEDDDWKEEDLFVLRKCIQELPASFRSVVVMRDIEGLSYEEIAEIEEIPVGTVRSRLNRAREMLKETFFVKRNCV